MRRRYALVLCTLALLGSLISPAAPSSANRLEGKKTLRVMTFNNHVGVGIDKKLDLQRIADVIIRELFFGKDASNTTSTKVHELTRILVSVVLCDFVDRDRFV